MSLGELGMPTLPSVARDHSWPPANFQPLFVSALADEKISIRSMNTVTDARDHIARMQIGIEITGLPQLSRVLARIAQLPNILNARRKK